MRPRLLIIDDDVELCELLSRYLIGEGFDVDVANDPVRGLARLQEHSYALALLDVMLPGQSGFEVLKRIRAESAIPVLMLTARGDDVDRIVGLELGADDYLPKPFNSRELVARIHAILRRAAGPAATQARERTVVGDVELDAAARYVRCGGRVLELTGVEFSLLEELLRGAGRVVQREDLFRKVLGRREVVYDRSLDMHMSNLRKKLGPGAGGSERIKTVRGVGYIFAMPPQNESASPP